jgi:drug/metabolite transporter (DMT)-like permease
MSFGWVCEIWTVRFLPSKRSSLEYSGSEVFQGGCCVLGHVELAASTAMYGLGIVAQSVAARRADRSGVGLGLLARLAADRLYQLGFAGQVGGFVLAFLARAELPLYLVQAGASCAVGLATVFGVLVLGWRVRPVEVMVLGVMAAGLVLLATASVPSVAHDVPVGLAWVLLSVSLLVGVIAGRACRTDSVLVPALLAGAAFAVVAISSRSLADEPILHLPLHPLAWLMLMAAVLGQACMSVALAGGSAMSTVAAMDAASMVLTSVVGITALGDRVAPGREWSVVLGLALVVLGVLVLGSGSRVPSVMAPRPAREAA